MPTTVLADDPPYLTAAELAARLRMHVKWVQAQCRTGRLVHLRVGREIRFTPAHVEQIERDLTIAPRSARPRRRSA